MDVKSTPRPNSDSFRAIRPTTIGTGDVIYVPIDRPPVILGTVATSHSTTISGSTTVGAEEVLCRIGIGRGCHARVKEGAIELEGDLALCDGGAVGTNLHHTTRFNHHPFDHYGDVLYIHNIMTTNDDDNNRRRRRWIGGDSER